MRDIFNQEIEDYINALQQRSLNKASPASQTSSSAPPPQALAENAHALRRLAHEMAEAVFAKLDKYASDYGPPDISDVLQESRTNTSGTSTAALNESLEQQILQRMEKQEAELRAKRARGDQMKKEIIERQSSNSHASHSASESDILRARQEATYNQDEHMGENASVATDFEQHMDGFKASRAQERSSLHAVNEARRQVQKVEHQQSRPMPEIERLFNAKSVSGTDADLLEQIKRHEQQSKRLKAAQEGSA